MLPAVLLLASPLKAVYVYQVLILPLAVTFFFKLIEMRKKLIFAIFIVVEFLVHV